MRIHDIGHMVVHLGVDGLAPSGYTGLDSGADGIPAGGLQVVVQIVQAVLDGGQGGEYGAAVDACQQGALGDGVTLLHMELFHLHGGGHRQIYHVFTHQGAGAGDGGLDGAGGDSGGLDVAAALGGDGALDLAADIKRPRKQRDQYHGDNGNYPLHDALPLLGFGWFGHRETSKIQNKLHLL